MRGATFSIMRLNRRSAWLKARAAEHVVVLACVQQPPFPDEGQRPLRIGAVDLTS